jgi:poly-gamma-glutamate synthesis protein (capsule biosynthesis protein)
MQQASHRLVDLRCRALAAVLAIGGLAAPVAAQPATEPLKPAPVPSTPMPDGFSFAAVGDIILLRPMLATIEARSPDMLRLLRGADVTFGNFETMSFDLASFNGAPAAESGGTWMLAAPGVPKDIAAMGFDIVSVANNHATDWGIEGLRETMARLDGASLVHAGAGRNLQAARGPRYHDGPQGRVGLVAATSTFPVPSRAGDPLGEAPGRPGINPLRAEREVLVSRAQWDTLADLARAVPDAPPPKIAPGGPVRLFGTTYRATATPGDKLGIAWRLNQSDVAGNLLAVRQAKQNGNFAVFSLHNHEPSNATDTPAEFAREMAHRAIDEGADAFVGHGPHILRGIEIYKGKPIFYSLGNFAMMNNSLDVQPRDLYEQYGVEPGSATTPELLHARNARIFADPRQFESVIAVTRYAGGQVAEIRLYPIDLGSGVEGAGKGVPTLADAAAGRRILETLRRLSAPYGTQIAIEKGVGVIRPAVRRD